MEVAMIQTILSAIAVYISTSIDYLFILLILFSQTHTKKEVSQVYWGQYLGTSILVAASLFTAYVLNFIPQDWVIGLLGLIPLYLGIRLAVAGEEEVEEEDVLEQVKSGGTNGLIWTVSLITIASGGDNLGIYIPYFTALSITEIFIVFLVFIIAIAILNYTSYRLAKISFVAETLEKYERLVVPLVFVGLGIFIMVENQTIQTLFNWIM